MEQGNVDIHQLPVRFFRNKAQQLIDEKAINEKCIRPLESLFGFTNARRGEIAKPSKLIEKAQIFPRPNREQRLMQHVTSDFIRWSSKLTLFSHSAIFYLLLLHIAPERKEKTFSSRLDPQLQTSKMETFTKSMKAEIIRFWVRSDKRIGSARRRRSARSWFGLCEP